MPMRSGCILSDDDLQKADDAEKETLLDHDSEPDEEMLFNRASSADGQLHIDGKISSVRIQIKEVTDVIRNNVQKVIERGDRLEDLQVASDRLSSAGYEFLEAAKKAQQREWMQNLRSRIIIAAVTIMAILCIIDSRTTFELKMRALFFYSFELVIGVRTYIIFSSGCLGTLPSSQVAKCTNQRFKLVPIIIKYS